MGRTHRRTGRQRGKRAWGQEGMGAGGMTNPDGTGGKATVHPPTR